MLWAMSDDRFADPFGNGMQLMVRDTCSPTPLFSLSRMPVHNLDQVIASKKYHFDFDNMASISISCKESGLHSNAHGFPK
jgi:hypothetical protein